jgi:outer membrane immunogenic protein
MRKHIGLAFVSAIALGLAGLGTAGAADLPMKALPPPVPVFSWAGWYMGADAGAAWSKVTETHSPFFPATAGAAAIDDAAITSASSPSFKTTGFTGGLYGGYNFQSGNIVYGVEADISGMSLMNSTTGVFPFPSTLGGTVVNFGASTSYRTNWEATLRGRLGIVAASDWLFYATGGGAVADEKIMQVSGSAVNGDSFSKADFTNTRWGWVAGGGIEHAFTPNWIMRIEFLHSDFGTANNATAFNLPVVPVVQNGFCIAGQAAVTITTPGAGNSAGCSISTRMTTDVVRVGLSYKFGGPVVAKY